MMKKKGLLILFILFFANISKVFGSWDPAPVTITSDVTGIHYLSQRIAFNNSGYGIAAWAMADAADNIFVQLGTTQDFGRTWSNITTLATTPSDFWNTRPRVVIDESNNAIVAWQVNDVPGNNITQVSPYGANPVSITTLDSDLNIWGARPEIVMDQTGHAIVVWDSYDTPSTSYFVKFSRSSDHGKT